MPKTTSDIIQDIYIHYSKNDKMFTPTDVYKEIVKDLNSLADAWWTHPYVYNLHNGDQTESVGNKMQWAIGKLHKSIKKKPPKKKPLPHQRAKRTLVLDATEYELHEIQDRLKPRERTIRLKEI